MQMLLDSLDDKEKDRIGFLASELATTLVNLGMSRRHIHETVIDFFWSRDHEVTGPEDLRVLFRRIFPHYHEFNVCFRASESVRALINSEFSSLNIEIHESAPEAFKECANDLATLGNVEQTRFLTVSKISALDPHTAIGIAIKRVSLLKNLYRMFNHDNAFALSAGVAIEQCCEDGIKVIYPEEYTKRAVSDSSDRLASRKLNYLLSNSRFLRGRHYEKFVSVSDFHGLSMDSDSFENKLLNLWISLETICPSVRGASKIESVVRGVLPCIGLRYIDRLFASLTADLSAWNRKQAGAILDKANSIGPSRKYQLLAICCLKSNEPALEELLSIFGDNHLLRNRVYSLHKSFSSKDMAVRALERHAQRVDWQLRRIYRARNSIVHLGEVPTFIAALVDSAHDYFDQVLSTVGEISCGPNGFTNFDTAFDYLGWEHETYMKRLDSLSLDNDDSARSLLWRRKSTVSRESVLKPPVREQIPATADTNNIVAESSITRH